MITLARLNNTTLILAVIAITLLGSLVLLYQFASAANTNSIDLEDSSSQYLSITDGSQTGLDLSGDLTFETWLKLEHVLASDGDRFNIISKWGTPGNRSYHFGIINNAGTIKGEFEVSANGTDFDTLQVTTGTLSTTDWYHLAMTWDASASTAEFFLNGVSLGTDAGSVTSINNSGSAVNIGNVQSSGYFDGLLDDIRIWNDIRTDAEIANNYQSELVGNETGFAAYWKLNNDAYIDQTTNGNTLTANNSPSFSADIPGLSAPPTQDLRVFKPSTDTITSDATLSDDDDLKLIDLEANKTYIISGAIFASSTTRNPDIIIAFNIPSGAVADIGFLSTSQGIQESDILQGTGPTDITSDRIGLARATNSLISIQGTIQMGSTDGDVTFKWAQAQSSADSLSVIQGSYLLAEEID